MSYPQQPPPQFQPPQPYQQFQPPGPMGMLQLTIQGSAMTSNMIPPTVHLNGYPVPVKYGRNDIPVPAGPLHIDIHAQWIRVYGKAALDCTVQPNQAVPVFYASPFHQFTSGSIGHTKVKRRGLGALIGIIAAIVVVSVLLTVLSSLG
ncbi:hypothetical protein [Kribbella sp. NPDC000426]|uniref:hypothetical protein n=1 Tax=Kribbella sp. NPDC000426 TaxID=3154255 RepID=UPI00332F53B5